MVNRIWMPAVATLALLLSACGDSQEEANLAPDEPSPVAEDEVVQEQEAPAAAENAAQVPDPDEMEDDVEARQAAEELERADALRDDAQDEQADSQAPAGEEVQADESTLAADPDDVLEEGGAMPGEVTRSDVDEMIEETEQRFQEAQRRLEEQFQEVEQQETVSGESPDEETFSTDWEAPSSLPDNSRLDENLEATDVDALIEDTERRFEEAQQRLEEQFKEIEREHNDTRSRGAILEHEEANTDAGAQGEGESATPAEETQADQ